VAVEVKTRWLGSIQLLEVHGSADVGLLARLADGLAAVVADGERVVVDLSDLVLTDLPAVRGFLAKLIATTPESSVVLCCRRLSGRRILRRCGGPRIAIAASHSDALAAATDSPPVAATTH
jgi:hypothetical protein